LEKYRSNPKSVSFEELKSLLESYGFEVKNFSGGSHYSVSHPIYKIIKEMEPNSIPRKKPTVLKVYVKKAIDWIDLLIEIQKAEAEKND